jgi:hypothetical protein
MALQPSMMILIFPIYQNIFEGTGGMNKKYENISAYAIREGSKNAMVFLDISKEKEFEFTLDSQLQTDLLARLVFRHVHLFQGKNEKIPYSGSLIPIEGDKSAETLTLIQKLRNEKPIDSNSENIRKFMLDLAQEAERLEYIFCTHNGEYIDNRFGWLYALLSDIQTLIEGFAASKNGRIRSSTDISLGGGNLAIPILVCTGLELVSALHTGRTRYLFGDKYNAEENVRQFIECYLPVHSKKIPKLIWDGVRNGVDHLFIPKSMQCAQYRIDFNFRRTQMDSDVIRSQGGIYISIDATKFYKAVKLGIEKYKSELENNEGRQRNFINAWSSIEEYSRNITNDDRIFVQ